MFTTLSASTAATTRQSAARSNGRVLPRRSRAARASRVAASGAVEQRVDYPSFLPAEKITQLEEPAVLDCLRRYKLETLKYNGESVDTAFIPPLSTSAGLPPLILLHGFDSSSLEFRRLLPLLGEVGIEAWAMDILGNGFTTATDPARFDTAPLGPKDRSQHIQAFLEQKLSGRPAVVLGASLGGAAAIDFALAYPESVLKLVLIDAQALIEGIGPMASLPKPLAALGAELLRTRFIRQTAGDMSYQNKELATMDAVRIGEIHTRQAAWVDNTVAWMRSGGYAVASRLGSVTQPSLVLWGQQDRVLDPASAPKLAAALPASRLVWVPECGHVAHLEQPKLVRDLIAEFMRAEGVGSSSSGAAEGRTDDA